jgi:hypothetical protein
LIELGFHVDRHSLGLFAEGHRESKAFHLEYPSSDVRVDEGEECECQVSLVCFVDNLISTVEEMEFVNLFLALGIGIGCDLWALLARKARWGAGAYWERQGAGYRKQTTAQSHSTTATQQTASLCTTAADMRGVMYIGQDACGYSYAFHLVNKSIIILPRL